MEHVIEGCTCIGKICTGCQQLRCIGNYTQDKRLKSKLKSRCRICAQSESKDWRQKNWEYDQQRKRTWEKLHPEQTKAQRKRRVKHNPPLPRKTMEEKLAYQRKNNFREYHKDRQASMARSMSWRRKYPARWCAIQAARRARKTQAGGSYTLQEWNELCALYDNRCLACGLSDIKLQADHVIPIAKGGKSSIDNIQPLCKSCNSRKKDKIMDFRLQNT